MIKIWWIYIVKAKIEQAGAGEWDYFKSFLKYIELPGKGSELAKTY